MLAGYWIKNVSGAKILKGTKELTQTTDARQSIVSLNTIKCFSIFDFYITISNHDNPAHDVLFVIFVHFRWNLEFQTIWKIFPNADFLRSRESILSDDSEYYRVCPRVTSVHEFVVWWSGFDFFVISLPGVWLDSTFENSTNQITWFQSSINVKFLKRETKSSSADCHDDDLFYIPMFYLPFFLIFRIMHPPVIYRDHKIFFKLI